MDKANELVFDYMEALRLARLERARIMNELKSRNEPLRYCVHTILRSEIET
jgi:hypothetical protein